MFLTLCVGYPIKGELGSMYFLLLSVNSAPDTDNSCEKHPQSELGY